MKTTRNETEYVTFTTAGQLFGLPIERVQDVFKPARMTRVPLAGPEIAGVLNLRGRIVTAIHLSNRLDLPSRGEGKPPMAIGIEVGGESFGLLVDAVGEVLKLADGEREANPDQSRPQTRPRIRRRIPARWPASRRARRRSGTGFRRRGGGGVKVDGDMNR